jgi:hypothetical protein
LLVDTLDVRGKMLTPTGLAIWCVWSFIAYLAYVAGGRKMFVRNTSFEDVGNARTGTMWLAFAFSAVKPALIFTVALCAALKYTAITSTFGYAVCVIVVGLISFIIGWYLLWRDISAMCMKSAGNT